MGFHLWHTLSMLLRTAMPEDALAIARVHVRSWQAAYRGLIEDAYLDGLRAEDRASRYDFTHANPAKPYTMVAVEDGAIVGFATIMPSRDADLPEAGELAALYLDPERWDRGIGVAMIEAARAELVRRGFKAALLWVLAGNARAMRFYERDGWAADGSQRTQEIWGLRLVENRYRRELA